jgi:PleD family two-component response regulator
VTLSVGVNSLTADHSTTVAQAIEPADHSLYLSKKNGRNRVTLAGSETEIPNAVVS